MPYSEAAKRATANYKKKIGIVRVSLDMMPEERDALKAAAAAEGMSVKAYIMQLVEADTEKGEQRNEEIL